MPLSQTVYPITAVPVNPGSEVYTTPPAPNVTVPCVFAPGVTAVMVSNWPFSLNGPAASLARSVDSGTVTGFPAPVVTVSACGTGGSLTSPTLIETVTGADWSCPSFAVKVNVSTPLASGAGVYVRCGAVPLRAPRPGAVSIAKTMGSPSGSVPVSVSGTGVSSVVVNVCGSTVGGWFAVTLTVIVPLLQRGSGCPFVVPLSHAV